MKQIVLISVVLSVAGVSCEPYDLERSNPLDAENQATLVVTSPNGGENWIVASNHNITWTTSGAVANVRLDYTTNGTSWTVITASVSNSGSYAWTVPNAPSTTCNVRVTDVSNSAVTDMSNANFTISASSGLAIGQSYQGGIIAYILQPGDPGYVAGQTHGLIAAPSDQSTGIQWYNGTYVTTGATGTALGTGNANTNTIVSVQGSGSYAAKLCYDLVLGGYSDWYLPSKDELNKLYLNKSAIGGFANDDYWSSSEFEFNIAWSQYFGNGGQYLNGKANSTRVRAVRAF